MKNKYIVKVNKIIKYINGQIKIEVIKYKISTMFKNPVPSDMIKIFYINEISPKLADPILIDLDYLKYKCFTFPITNNKFIAIAYFMKHELILIYVLEIIFLIV